MLTIAVFALERSEVDGGAAVVGAGVGAVVVGATVDAGTSVTGVPPEVGVFVTVGVSVGVDMPASFADPLLEVLESLVDPLLPVS